MNDITRLLSAVEDGDPRAADELLPLVYQELRRLAAARMAHESPGQTLQPTALVHEAYLRLVGGDRNEPQSWDGRGHFFAAAAEAMRRILVESARRKQRLKHGGDREQIEFSDDLPAVPEARVDLLALDAALEKLKSADGVAAQLVQLRYFGGLTLAESARMLNLPPRTADRTWAYAKAWLHRELSE